MLIEKGRPDLAEQHFDLATADLPRWPVAHFDFARMLQNEQRYQDAIREYRLALAYETEPDEAAASHINLGAIYVQQNQLPAALWNSMPLSALHPRTGCLLRIAASWNTRKEIWTLLSGISRTP